MSSRGSSQTYSKYESLRPAFAFPRCEGSERCKRRSRDTKSWTSPRGTVISDDRSDQPGVVLNARCPRDHQSDRCGSNLRKSRSASPAEPLDGPPELICRHDAPEPQRPPTQNRHAQVQSSWTSVHSSTKTPHEQKRDLKRQVNALPFRWAGRNPNSTRRRHPGVHPYVSAAARLPRATIVRTFDIEKDRQHRTTRATGPYGQSP